MIIVLILFAMCMLVGFIWLWRRDEGLEKHYDKRIEWARDDRQDLREKIRKGSRERGEIGIRLDELEEKHKEVHKRIDALVTKLENIIDALVTKPENIVETNKNEGGDEQGGEENKE